MIEIPEKITQISLDKLKLWEKANVRKNLNNNKLYELAGNIEQNGLQHPLLVKRDSDGSFLVFVGQRRLEACKLVKLEKIPCIIFDSITLAQAVTLSLSENLYREKMHKDEIADAAFYLWGIHNNDKSKVAEILGVSKQTIIKYLDYHAIPLNIKKLARNVGMSSDQIVKTYTKFGARTNAIIKEFEKISTREGKKKLTLAVKEAQSTDSIERIRSRTKQLLNSTKIELWMPKDDLFILENVALKEDITIEEKIMDIIDDWRIDN